MTPQIKISAILTLLCGRHLRKIGKRVPGKVCAQRKCVVHLIRMPGGNVFFDAPNRRIINILGNRRLPIRTED